MSGYLFFRGCRRPFALKATAAPPSTRNASAGRWYSTDDKDESVIDKARSTADEFLRQAKEKSDSVGQTARETVEDAKEAVTGEKKEAKEKFKERVEKGDLYSKDRE